MKSVITIGLGYIGLPTSALIASKNIPVYGVDIDKKVVDKINKGEIHISEPDLENLVKKCVLNGFLKAGLKAVLGDVYLIVVPTPFKGNHEPDISYVEIATRNIIPLLKENDLYVIESTSPVGTTDKMRNLIYSERPELEDKISIAYCPERVLPGNIIQELINNDRVIGGVDQKSTTAAIQFYSQFVDGRLYPTNAKTAEMCKLTENASRDVQIAFANELSLICDKANINVWELINLANKHPRVNILQPGCGVGGHCIAVDPYFITSSYPLESKLIGTGREINNYKSFWCVEKINQEIINYKKSHDNYPKVALCGLAFKPNVEDLRESPALYIANKLIIANNHIEFFVVEPNIVKHENFVISNFNEAIIQSDIIVFLVGHREFKNVKLSDKIVVDFCNISKQND